MASLSFALAMATTTSSPPFFSKPAGQQRLKTRSKQTPRFQMSSNVASDDDEKPIIATHQHQKLILPKPSLDMQNVDRRNLLLGLGGISAVNLTGLPSAFAEAIKTPSIINPNCKDAGIGFNVAESRRPTACCPPPSKKGPETDYVLPTLPEGGKKRIRYPIHDAPEGYLKKFKLAMKLMRLLPDDDPRSFNNQAKIHCAYCNGSYTQIATGFPQELLIHSNWLFFPFHRWYIYFFERILGDLIEDPTFGLPYWSWDERDGMKIPAIFQEVGSESNPNPLYDVYRNPNRSPDAIVDLDWEGNERGVSPKEQEDINLCVMNRQMKRNAFDSRSFFGGDYVSGDKPIHIQDPSSSCIESGCHGAIHRWVGNPAFKNKEDLANFYSAGYDPLFYVHHSNIDRLWILWKGMEGKNNSDPVHPDWGETSYVFYDENQNPVRVYNKHCAELENLYEYKGGPKKPSWMDNPPTPRCKTSTNISRKFAQNSVSDVKLSDTVNYRLARPADKTGEKEILLLKGIKFNGKDAVKFDVFVNAISCDQEKITPCYSEYAGSFAAVPHNHDMEMSTTARFSLTELLEEIGADSHESIMVTIKPSKEESHNVTIDEIMITYNY